MKVGKLYQYMSFMPIPIGNGTNILLRHGDIVLFLEKEQINDKAKRWIYNLLLPNGNVWRVSTTESNNDKWFEYNFRQCASV